MPVKDPERSADRCHGVATELVAGRWQRAAQILVAISLPRERETPPRGARAFR